MTDSAPVQAGDILAGKYRVERVLGQGGMGVVVSALHVHLGDRVAIKFLLDSAGARPDIVARFLREAQAAVKVKSEHVARVIDVGSLESGAPYMVMEYLTGQDLSQLVEQRGPLPPPTAIDYVLQACEAIAEAHSLGIVHRDLKPANLFLSSRADGSSLVKVLDFGISKQTMNDGQVDLTATQSTLGSPAYMSPEQVRSAKKVDQRTDIWSLGVILTELVTGRHPFVAETLSAMMAAIVADRPRRLRELDPNAPAALEAVIERCLEKDIERRFESVADFALALRPIAPPAAQLSIDRIARMGRSGASSIADTIAGGPASSVEAATGPGAGTVPGWNSQVAPPRAKSQPLVVVGGVALAAALVAGAFFALRPTRPTEPRSEVSPPRASVAPAVDVTPPAAPSAAPDIAPSVSVSAAASSAPPSSKLPPKKPPGPGPATKTNAHADDRNW